MESLVLEEFSHLEKSIGKQVTQNEKIYASDSYKLSGRIIENTSKWRGILYLCYVYGMKNSKWFKMPILCELFYKCDTIQSKS